MDRITKELNELKSKEVNTLSTDKFTEQVKGLLENESAEDRRILREMGLNKHVNVAMNNHGKLIELEKFDRQFEGNVFHVDVIEKFCVGYRLKFLRARDYSGTIDAQLPAKIKEFCKKNDVSMDAATLDYKFFMLAPAECFNLQTVVIDRDPALFYKVDDNYYKLVYKWGNDFSITRAIIGWRWSTVSNFILHAICMSLFVSSLITPFIMSLGTFVDGLYYLMQLVIFALTYIWHMADNWNEGVIENNLSPNSWNQNKKYR